MIGCWLYTDIPGAGKGWTLAVFATSQADADSYVTIHNGGGRRIGKAYPGKVKADCGATTEAASAEIRRQLEARAANPHYRLWRVLCHTVL